MNLILLIPVGILIILYIVYKIIQHEKKRRKDLEVKAQTLGFSYTQKAGLDQIESAKDFHLFNIGHSKRIKNLMKREGDGVHTTLYDYQYTTGGGQSSHTFIQTVFQFKSDRLKLPAFILRPENVFHKIGQSFGYQDIDFDQFPDFSKQSLLRGDDDAAIRKLFNQEVITWFETEKKIILEARDAILICYRSGKRVRPDDLFLTYEKMQEIYHLFARRCDYL